MTNHKKEYDDLLKVQADIEKALRNRCIECSNFNKKKGECSRHGFVPVEYIYQKNECEEYDFLPFN